MGRIVDHAKEFGMGWMKPIKSKVLNDAGIKVELEFLI